jgi:hypothetical protein
LRSLLQSYPQGDKARFITAQEASTSGPLPLHFCRLIPPPSSLSSYCRILLQRVAKAVLLQVAGLVFYLAQDEAAAITGSNVWRVWSRFCTLSASRAL